VQKALQTLRGTASALEKHHRIQVLDEALDAAVKLSKRFIPDRQLPDKAVSLLDTACARRADSDLCEPARERVVERLRRCVCPRDAAVGTDQHRRAVFGTCLLRVLRE
jgi:type VI secretion system protein VasG